MKRHVLILGLVGGVLIAILRWSEYQFLVIEHSLEIYGAIVAIIFVVFGIWLGIKLTKPREKIVLREVLVPTDPAATFTLNRPQLDALGITPRELEILTLIAQGLSNRESCRRRCLAAGSTTNEKTSANEPDLRNPKKAQFGGAAHNKQVPVFGKG
jgi:DNA-binding CsgD family transcriptional regulator